MPHGKARQLLLQEHHDTPLAGHQGVARTYAALTERFYWPSMDKDVDRFVVSCDACQRNKPTNKATPGLLHPLPIPEQPFQHITTDFTYVPPSRDGAFDCIATYVDRLSRMVKFVPTRRDITSEEAARLYVDNVMCQWGLSESIVMDRDSKFTSSFFKEVFNLLGTKVTMSVAGGPELDGLSEREDASCVEGNVEVICQPSSG